MADRVEIVRIVFGEKRIAGTQGRVVNTKVFFENVSPAREGAKAFARRRGLAIVSAQIRQGLFAFEDCGHGLLAKTRAIRSDIGAVTALWQTDFRRAR
jgi:hypothetical protein